MTNKEVLAKKPDKGRIAGDDPTYRFELVRKNFTDSDGRTVWMPTGNGFNFISVSTFIGEVLAKPPSAMAYWGFRVGLEGVADLMAKDPLALVDLDKDELEELLKDNGINPNASRDAKGDLGNIAHHVLECLVPTSEKFDRERAVQQAEQEREHDGTEYGFSVIWWFDTNIQPYLDDGTILDIRSEIPVWSLSLQYCGTFDLAILWADGYGNGWEILDLKTHKPASGFTTEGKGPGYDSDAAQMRAYRKAFEEMGLGKTFRNRTIVARDREYRGSDRALEDYREVPEDFVVMLRRLYDMRVAFGSKEEE